MSKPVTTTEQMIYWLDSIIQAEHTEIDTVRGTETKRKIPSDPMLLEIRLRLEELHNEQERLREIIRTRHYEAINE